MSSFNDKFVKIPAKLNIKEKFLINSQTPAVVFLITRDIRFLPLRKISINFNSNFNNFFFFFYFLFFIFFSLMFFISSFILFFISFFVSEDELFISSFFSFSSCLLFISDLL